MCGPYTSASRLVGAFHIRPRGVEDAAPTTMQKTAAPFSQGDCRPYLFPLIPAICQLVKRGLHGLPVQQGQRGTGQQDEPEHHHCQRLAAH